MRAARRLLLIAGVTFASAAILLAAPVSAQQAPADADSRAVTSSGSYDSTVTRGGQSFPRSGTYEAAVTFSASVAITGLDILTQSGAYTANGPFTATVSAPDVAAFVVTGTFTASGTFSAGTFVSAGGWTLTSGGQASGTHQGGGTYNLAGSAQANGQYVGTVTDSAGGPFGINGTYQGAGTYTPPPIPVPTGGAPGLPGGVNPLEQLTSAISSLAAIAASGPATATAIQMRALPSSAVTPTATPSATPTPAPTPATGGPVAAPGTFAGTVAPTGVSLTLFTGSRTQLQAAATATNAITLAATVGGRMLVYVVGAPSFVNTDFDAAFPSGFSGTPIIIRK